MSKHNHDAYMGETGIHNPAHATRQPDSQHETITDRQIFIRTAIIAGLLAVGLGVLTKCGSEAPQEAPIEWGTQIAAGTVGHAM